MNRFFFLAFIILIRACYSYDIQEIPEADRQKLDQFFKFIITRTSLGYSLCGDKPCSVETYPKLSKIPPRCSVKVFFNFFGYSTLIKGWEIWSKYAEYFPSNHFIFRHVPEYNTFVFINKKAARTVIEENLDLFQKYAKVDLSLEEFLQEVSSPKNKNNDYLVNYHMSLLGILLGYGRNNALAFTQKSYVQNLKKLEFDKSHQPLNLILNPGFVAIQNGTNENENDRIRKIFRHAKQEIKKHFQNENYFETFITLFNESTTIK